MTEVMRLQSLLHLIRRHSEAVPDHPAIVLTEGTHSLTYADLLNAVLRMAGQLRAAGVKRGEAVILIADNHWSVLPLLVASSATGCVLVPLSPLTHPDNLRHIVRETGARVVLHAGEAAPAGAPAGRCRALETFLASDAEALELPVTSESSPEPTLVIYTSGTSGTPKGVVLSESNLVANASTIAGSFEITRRDRLLCVMPLYHMNGIMITGMVPLVAGATVVLGERCRFHRARAYLRTVAEQRITILSLIPSFLAVLTRITAPTDLAAEGVRYALCGTAPLESSLWRRFEDHFGVPLYQGYGLTETTCWATMTLPSGSRRYDVAGTPVGCDVGIDRSDAGAGEILIRGPIVMRGYFNRKAATESEWLRTGDLGFIDDDGQLVITGRKKDTIIRYGMNIQPAEIDRVLVRHPAVEASTTVGVQDPIAGETVEVCWTPVDYDAAPSERELRSWLGTHVSTEVMPDRMHCLPRLPLNDIGKVDRGVLREIVSGVTAARIVEAIDTRKWVRYKLHDSPDVMKGVQQAVLSLGPLRFLKYWGAGDKRELDEFDRMALDRVHDLLQVINDQYAYGTELTLIFTDIHYRINGFDQSVTDRYVDSVMEYARGLGFAAVRASDLWRRSGLDLAEVVAHADTDDAIAHWREMDIRDELVVQAAKHGQGADPDRLARIYYRANTAERQVFADLFADHIFLTYNRRSQDELLPPLPRIYIHSYKPKVSEKPWFVTSGSTEMSCKEE